MYVKKIFPYNPRKFLLVRVQFEPPNLLALGLVKVESNLGLRGVLFLRMKKFTNHIR